MFNLPYLHALVNNSAIIVIPWASYFYQIYIKYWYSWRYIMYTNQCYFYQTYMFCIIALIKLEEGNRKWVTVQHSLFLLPLRQRMHSLDYKANFLYLAIVVSLFLSVLSFSAVPFTQNFTLLRQSAKLWWKLA